MSIWSQKTTTALLAIIAFGLSPACLATSYPIVDTGQVYCYDNSRITPYPATDAAFFGQDAQYQGNAPKYRDNGDDTVTDLVTGLMWQQDPGAKKTFRQAVAGASACTTGGYSDWRLPTIKELYSLILFSGTDPDPRSTATGNQRPFIDTKFFKFRYGDAAKGERIIDSQYATCTKYVSTTMHADETVFGVNFADGRIKGYPMKAPHGRGEKTFFVHYVRGNPKYGKNDFVDNRDGTITDRATGLIWMKGDSGHLSAGPKRDGKMNWQQALAWVEGLEYAGHDDWRLPNVKELQSIVDYTRSPATSRSAAIDPIFETSVVLDEGGKRDYPFYWSGTTHGSVYSGAPAAYVAFGRSPGWMRSFTGQYQLLDVHGAGSQRSDPKTGDPAKFPRGRGPQGDVIRIFNFVRPVRGGVAELQTSGPAVEAVAQPPQRTQPGQGERVAPGAGNEGGNPGENLALSRFIRRLDRDGDGKVSRREFDGPPMHFKHTDRNGDGYITVDEAPTGPPGHPGGRRPR